MRLAIQRANTFSLLPKGHPDRVTERDLRVLHGVLFLTASYSKLTDRTFVNQIAHAAGVPDPDNTRKSLRKLARLGVIVWKPGRGAGKSSLVGLPASEESRVAHDPAFPPTTPETESGPTVLTGSGTTTQIGSDATRLPRSKSEKEDRDVSSFSFKVPTGERHPPENFDSIGEEQDRGPLRPVTGVRILDECHHCRNHGTVMEYRGGRVLCDSCAGKDTT
jgi:hypothetical protein